MAKAVPDPSDLSALLFSSSSSEVFKEVSSYVGPIRVCEISATHGRGVIASKPIEAGTCLFVTSPTVAPNLQTVSQQWQTAKREKNNSSFSTDDTLLLEQITELVLVKAMKDTAVKRPALAKSFMALTGSSSSNVAELDVHALIGERQSKEHSDEVPTLPPDQELLQIIRRNAFGPDALLSYKNTETRWTTELESGQETTLPPRLLGIYPLAAMLNHACVGNAIRVFAGDVMIVHASANIKDGEEIVWSYLPSTTPYLNRLDILTRHYGFECCCDRCVAEKLAYDNDALAEDFRKLEHIVNHTSNNDSSCDEIDSQIQWLENDLLVNSSLSNEVRRYLRVGAARLYILYLNKALGDMPFDPEMAGRKREDLLNLCTQLHFSFCACNNGSTEHFSILHVCYELIGSLHTHAIDKSKTLPKVRFWTEQLKKAHMTRYGQLGENLESVRAIMKHTRIVLRTENGLDMVSNKFI